MKRQCKFAAVVGSSERLQLLLLLTYADLASVGPDVVNQWKIDLLLQLYYQTDAHFRDDKLGDRFRKEIVERRASSLASRAAKWQSPVVVRARRGLTHRLPDANSSARGGS